MAKIPAKHRGDVVPCLARFDQIVEIHWQLADGRQLTTAYTVPPASVTEARTTPATADETA